MDDEEDSHICLKCNTTILGLDNYISHRRSKCTIPTPRLADIRPRNDENSPSKALDFFSSLNLRYNRLEDFLDFDLPPMQKSNLDLTSGSSSKHNDIRFPDIEIEANFEHIDDDLMKGRKNNYDALDLDHDNLMSVINMDNKTTRSILDSDIFSTSNVEPTTSDHNLPLNRVNHRPIVPISGGKWIPDKSGNPKSYFFCRACNRSLSSHLLYDKHLQSELHFKRLAETSAYELDDTMTTFPSRERTRRPTGREALRRAAATKRSSKTTKKTITARVQQGPGGRFLFCGVCSVRVLERLVGKHLVSHFHCIRARQQPELARSLVLTHMSRIVRHSPFQCALCRFYCNSPDTLLLHFASKLHCDMDVKQPGFYWCQQCKVETDTSDTMVIHLRSLEHNQLALTLNHTVPIVVRKRSKLECHHCNQSFALKIELLHHFRKRHNFIIFPEQMFNCTLCGYASAKHQSLQQHVLKCHGACAIEEFFCGACERSFPTRAECQEHKRKLECRVQHRRAQGRDVSRRCSLCGHHCEDLAQLKEHMFRFHYGALHRCEHCHEVFAISQDLSRHARDGKCAGAPPLIHTLEDSTPSNAGLLEDVMEAHAPLTENSLSLSSLQKPHSFVCDLCGKTYTRRRNLTQHFAKMHPVKDYVDGAPRYHDEPPVKSVASLQCDLCSFVTSKKCFIERHIKAIHFSDTRTRDWKCQYCPKAFFEKYSMRQHEKLHFPKQFRCNEPSCCFRFRYLSELRRHQNTVHSYLRCFPCRICDYVAKSKFQLKRHAIKHQEDRPYLCQHCGNRFVLYSHLRRHTRLHTGSKPFKCPHCSYSSNTLENLRKHVLETRKHKDKKMYQCKLCFGEANVFSTNFANEFRAHLHELHQSQLNTMQLGTRQILAYVEGICDNYLQVSKDENLHLTAGQSQVEPSAALSKSQTRKTKKKPPKKVTLDSNEKKRVDFEDDSQFLKPKLNIPLDSIDDLDILTEVATVNVVEESMSIKSPLPEGDDDVRQGLPSIPIQEVSPTSQMLLLEGAGTSPCIIVCEIASPHLEWIVPAPTAQPMQSLLSLHDDSLAMYEGLLDADTVACGATLSHPDHLRIYEDDVNMKVVVSRVEDEFLIPNALPDQLL